MKKKTKDWPTYFLNPIQMNKSSLALEHFKTFNMQKVWLIGRCETRNTKIFYIYNSTRFLKTITICIEIKNTLIWFNEVNIKIKRSHSPFLTSQWRLIIPRVKKGTTTIIVTSVDKFIFIVNFSIWRKAFWSKHWLVCSSLIMTFGWLAPAEFLCFLFCAGKNMFGSSFILWIFMLLSSFCCCNTGLGCTVFLDNLLCVVRVYIDSIIVANTATASIFYGIWIIESGATVFTLNLDKISLKKLFPTMNI